MELIEDFGKPRRLKVYYLPWGSKVGVGYYRHGRHDYSDGRVVPLFGMWLIDKRNNLKQL